MKPFLNKNVSLIYVFLTLFSCHAVNTQNEEDSARPVILNDGETDEKQSTFVLQNDESGLVSIAALEIDGEQMVKEGQLKLNHLQEQWLFEWKSWKNNEEELLWLHLIDGKKLVQQQGFYLPRMGIPLQADGNYKIDVRILYNQNVLAKQSLHLQLKEQYYGGEGSGGMLTFNGRPHAAQLFAFDPLQAKVAFSESDSHGNFYFKYKYKGNYKIFAFNNTHYSLSETIFQLLEGGATIYHALELKNTLANIEQTWLLASGSNEIETVEDGVKESFQLGEASLHQPLLAGVISENGRLSWQYFSNVDESIELNIDRLVYQDRRALLFVLQPNKIPFTRWLHTNATAAKSFSEERISALLDNSSSIDNTIIRTTADMVKYPQISAQNIGAITTNSQLLLSSITGQDITNWRWFINGEYLGDDLSAIYDVPEDYDRDVMQIRLSMQDRRGNSFEREYQIAVHNNGIIWNPDTPAPYWVKDWGKQEQEFFFEVNFVDENIDFDQENRLFHWYLEESNTVATVPSLTAKANIPFKTKFERGGLYRLRLQTATENSQESMSYENEFMVNAPPSGLQISGASQVQAGEQISFTATLDSLAAQMSEGDELSYSWFIDEQPIANFPQISLSPESRVLTFQSNTLALRDKIYTLKLEINDGFYPRSAVAEHTFTEKALPLNLQIENTLATAAANYHYLEGAEQTFTAVFINNSNANIDTALFNYSWFLDSQNNGQYTELDTNNAPVDKWEANADQLNLMVTDAAHYRLRLVIDYDDGVNQQIFEDELLFRVNAPLDALNLNYNANELEAGETLLLETDLANFEAQEQDGDTLTYRWRYWQDGNFDDAEVIELQESALPAGFALNEGQLEFTVDVALAADTEWKFQVAMNDGVYADWLWSASQVVQLKKSVWTLALATESTAPYLVNVPFDFTTQVANLPLSISEEQLSYQWQLEIMDNLNYRDVLSNGNSAEATLNIQDTSASLLFLSGGQYRLSCRASYSSQNNSSQRQQMLTFKVNTPPGALQLTANKSSINAGELLDLNALLDNIAAQQADGDVLSYTWQEEINSQFVDLDPLQLAGGFSLNNEQNILSYQSSIALSNKLERTFRVKAEDGVYPQGIFSNTLTIHVEPAASNLEIVHISDNDPNYVFVYGRLEEFGVVPQNLPAGLSSAALSYQWGLQIRNQQGDYVDAASQHANILGSNLAQYSPTLAVDADFRVLLEGVYSDAQGQTRTLSTQRDFSVNREIDAVSIESSAATAEAGETLSFEARISNESEQQGDTLSYLWQEEAADGSFNDISDGDGWQLNGKKLSFTVPLELAAQETKKIRVLVDDAHYTAVSSRVSTVQLNPLNLTLNIESRETVLKLNQMLEFSANLSGLNNLLNKNAFSYSWELQVIAADGSLSDAASDFSAVSDNLEDFEPTFSRSGNYRLNLNARYGSNTPRMLNASLDIHLNHLPATATIQSSAVSQSINAGENVELTALLSNLQEQLDEGDTLNYQWQRRLKGASHFNDLDAQNLAANVTQSDNQLQIEVPASLNSQEEWEIRVIVSDSQGQESTSTAFSLTFKVAPVQLGIIVPQNTLLVDTTHTFSTKIEDLPSSVSYADLRYKWILETQQTDGSFIAIDTTQAYIDNSTTASSSFLVGFKEGGDYRLTLEVRYGSQPERILTENATIHINHPPQQLDLVFDPLTSELKAGSAVEIVANFAEQQHLDEGDTLTWNWMCSRNNGAFIILEANRLPTGFSFVNERRVRYSAASTLVSDETLEFRVLINDSVYPVLNSQKSLDVKAARLTPVITLPTAPYKINKQLSISGSVAASQLPTGIRAADLSYVWKVQQQNSGNWQDINSSFSASSSNTSTFQPTFSKSGDYRLHLSVSFGSGNNRRSFSSTQVVHLNHQPTTPTLSRLPAVGEIKAGDSVQLQANIGNLAAQTAENDTLSWSWQIKQDSAAWQDLNKNSLPPTITLSNNNRILQYTVASTLPSDQQLRLRVKMNDGVYSDTAYSSELDIDLKAAQLTPIMRLSAAPYKINEQLNISGSVPTSQLPTGIRAADLSYVWEVQQQNSGSWQNTSSGYRASSSNASNFQPTFSRSGDYRLHLSVSFGSAGSRRSFSSTQVVHLNHQPNTPTLSRLPAAGDIQAGDSVSLEATISSLDLQTAEGDTLRWNWQMKQDTAAWRDIDNSNPPAEITLSNAHRTLSYTPPNTLASDEQRSFRIKVSDGIYSSSSNSQPLSIDFKTAQLTSTINLPTAPYKINEQLSISGSVPASQLPTGIRAADLSYSWTVQQQSSGSWQDSNNGFNASGETTDRFRVTFSKSGDYRLLLRVSFGSGSQIRTFNSRQDLHLNHQPNTPTLMRTPTTANIQAGDSVQLQATIGNLAAQTAENDTLNWSWQIKQTSGAWSDIDNSSLPAEITLSNANRTLQYTVPRTLPSDQQRRFRVKMNDGVYSDTAYSSALAITFKAALLTPAINLPTAPYKINEQLSIGGSVSASQLPTGISAADLSYLWKVQQQNNGSWQDTSSGFSANSSNASTFRPTFSSSGDYRLHLSVSFGSAGNRRSFSSTQVVHLNHQPTTPTLSRLPAAGEIKAGDSVQLQATIGNLAAQTAENDTLSWSWQIKQGASAWSDIDNNSPPAEITLSNANRTLQYTVPSTLSSNQQLRLRVKLNDGVYNDTAYSSELDIDLKAAQLTPTINLSAAPYKINEQLNIGGSVPASQLPSGITAANLSYAWKVQRQNNGNWQDTSSGFSATSNNRSNFQPTFSNSGDYRLHLSVSFGSGNNSRTFIAIQALHINHQPATLTLTPNPATGNINGGQTIALRAALSNLAQQTAENDSITWTWQRAIIASNATLQDSDFRLIQGTTVNQNYAVPITQDREQKLYYRLTLSDGVYAGKTLTSNAITLIPLSISVSIITPQQTTPNLKYKSNSPYTFSASLTPQPNNVILNYVWSLERNNAQLSNSQQPTPSFNFNDSGEHQLKLKISYSSGGNTRALNEVSSRININTPPQNISISAQKRAANRPLTTLDLSAVTAHNVSTDEYLILTPIVANAALQNREGDTLSYRWLLKTAANAASLPASSTTVNSSHRGYSQDNSTGVLTIDSQTLRTNNSNRYQRFMLQVRDDVYNQWIDSSEFSFTFDRDPDQLQLKKSTALVSSDSRQPSHINTLERSNYTIEFYDPDNRIVNLRVRANNGTQGLRLETPSTLSVADAQGKRQSSFHLTANRLSNVNINLRVRATGNASLLRQNFFLQRQNIAPSAIQLSSLGNAVSRQASSQTTLAARQTHNLKISFRDPNHQVVNNWKIERVQNSTLTPLSQAASQGIGYTLVGQGNNNAQTGERSNISFNLRLDAPLRFQETVQLRISLSTDGAASYTLSEDFYLARNAITPSDLRFFRRVNNVDYEIDPREHIHLPVNSSERIFARIEDPDSQVSRLNNAQRPNWLQAMSTQFFGPVNNGIRQTPLFILRAVNTGANSSIQFSLGGNTAQSLLPANNSYSLAVASVGNVATLRLFAHKNTDRTGDADEEELSRDPNRPSFFPAGAVIALRPQEHYNFPHEYRLTTNQTGFRFLNNNNAHRSALDNNGKPRLLRGDERYNLRYILDKRIGYQNQRRFTVSLFHHSGTLLARSTYYLQVPRFNWTVNYRFDSPILQSSRVHDLDGWDDYVLMATNKGLIRTHFDERDGRLALQSPQTYQSNSNVHKVDVYNNKAYSVRNAGSSARLDISRLSSDGSLSVENSLSFADLGVSSSAGRQPIFAKLIRVHNREFLIFGYSVNEKTWLNLYRFTNTGELNRTLLSSLSLPGHADELTPIEGTAFFTMISWGAASANGIRSFAIDNNSGIYSLRIVAAYNKDNSAGIREPTTTLQYVHISPDRSKIALATWLGISYGSINANGELNIASVNTNFGHLIKRIYYNDGLYLVQNYQHYGASHLYWAHLNMDNNSFTVVEDYREGQFNISGGFNTSLYHSQRRYVLKAWENDLVRFGDEQDHGIILAYRAPGS